MTAPDLENCTDETIALQLLQSQETFQLSPFEKVPTEIMIFIFILATADGRGAICFNLSGEGKNVQCTGAIFSLTWVCFEWRDIILSTPSFWTSYQFRELEVHSNIEAYTPMINRLNELLLRSGTAAPLCLHLEFGYRMVGRTYPVLDALIEHTSRWKEVILEFWGSSRPASNHIRAQTTSFPNLEFLHISSLGRYVFELGSFGEAFGDCPRLHHLEITSFHPREPFDLQHLTTLDVGVCIGASFALLLQRCPVLETFRLFRPKPDPVPDSPGMVPILSTVHHPHLKHLTVEHLDYQSSMTFWRDVSLPNLNKVRAKIYVSNEDQSRFDELKQMLVDSQCVLEQLDLFWYRNHPRNSVESLVEGIRLSSQTHTHCGTSMESNPRLTFNVVPSNQKLCSYCEAYLGRETSG